MATTSPSTATLPYHLRVWIDVEPGTYDKSCFEVSKKDKSGCFDTILQYFDKKTEQSNSESWHRCFVQNFASSHAELLAKEEEDQRRDSSIVWIHSLLDTNLFLRAIQGHS